MKCPKCGADSSVLETRSHQAVLLRRKRKCFNGHVFQTFEVFPGNLDKRTLTATRHGIEQRAVAARRRSFVLANPEMSAAQLARRLNITEARVRQLR